MNGWPSIWWEPGCEDANTRDDDEYDFPVVKPGETWIPDEIIIELPFN